MALIDNIAELQQSSQGRAGTPDGNIHFHPDGSLEIITVEELPTLPAPINGPNPISNADGVTFRALLEFEANERSSDEILRGLSKFMLGNFKRAGAGIFINGKAPSDGGSVTGGDRKKIRGYGWDEYADRNATLLNRTYHAGFSLGSIDPANLAYIQNVADGAVTDATFAGQLDEAFQTFGTTANGDTGAGDFDNRAEFIASIRSWNKTHERKNLTDSNLLDAGGYSGKYGIGEANHPYNASFLEVDVEGGGAIAPWSTMAYSTLDSARSESGLVGGPYNFSEQIANPANGTLAQLVAYADAQARLDADIDAHATNTRNGKQEDTLYTLTATGAVRWKQGLFPENIPVADRANTILVDDLGAEVTFESVAGGTIPVGDVASGDASAFYHMYFEDGQAGEDFDTTSAVTVDDASGTPIKGLVGGLTEIPFDFAYSSNTQSGFTGGTDRDIVIIVEGINGAGSKEERYTITNSTTLSFPCIPSTQDNI